MTMKYDFEVFKDATPQDKKSFGLLAHVSPEVRAKAYRASAGEFEQVKKVIEKRLKELNRRCE